MLSILIPVYNYNIFPLVKLLNEEAVNMRINYEILCVDDASDNKEIQLENTKVQSINNCSFEVLPDNVGRSKIRNILVQKAKFEKLIFLDTDVLPKRKGFIKTYLNSIGLNDISFGGILYPEISDSLKKSLHYKYGKKREALSFKQRQNVNDNSFTSANFAIKKKLFKNVKFNEIIKTYGYEDVIFSKDLVSKGYKIAQIDNPVVHYGILKNNNDFILKEQESLETLHKLYHNKTTDTKNVKLIQYYILLKRAGIINLYKNFFKLIKKNLLKNLRSDKPSLLLFDLYRLGYFCSIKN